MTGVSHTSLILAIKLEIWLKKTNIVRPFSTLAHDLVNVKQISGIYTGIICVYQSLQYNKQTHYRQQGLKYPQARSINCQLWASNLTTQPSASLFFALFPHSLIIYSFIQKLCNSTLPCKSSANTKEEKKIWRNFVASRLSVRLDLTPGCIADGFWR